MKTILLLGLGLLLKATPVHSWYPLTCCSGNDCMEVNFLGRSYKNDYIVQNETFGLVTVPHDFPIRPSQDHKYHICIRDSRILCFFVPTLG